MATTFPFTFDATFGDDEPRHVTAPSPRGPNPGPLEFTRSIMSQRTSEDGQQL